MKHMYKNNVIWGIFLKLKKIRGTIPCSFTISLIPCENPLNFGFLDVWSLINFTLTVSMGVTARMASLTPAPKPQNRLPVLLRVPLCLSRHWFLKYSLAPNLRRTRIFFDMILTFVSYCNVENTKKILWNELKFGESQTSHFQGIL